MRTERCCGQERGDSASPDRTPRVEDLSGVEVVRQLGSPNSEVLMTRSNAKPSSRLKSRSPKRKSTQKAPRVSCTGNGKTKHDRVLSMLRTRNGATIAAIMRVTNWQPHSVRGFLAGVVKRKLGLSVASEKTSSGRVYRIVEVKTLVSPRKAAPAVEQPNA